MVLLGEPGSGKTVLLLRLALDMLAARRSEEPVPVLLRLSTWDPSSQPFSEWISLRLVEDYGCSPAIGSLLTSGGQLLPILDGLDEMPDERQSEALRAINASLTSETALVVASRTSEYLNALSVIDADVLTGAAAVEIQPLAPQTIRDYLIRATPPERAQRWIGLFDSDRDDHNGRMVRALATPLAASLARAAYADRDKDPQPLLELADRDAVEGHLLDQFIPSLYPAFRRSARIGRRTWTREQAGQWLGFLASHTRNRNTHDIAWWELAHALPRWYRTLAGAFIGLIAGGLVGAFTGGPTSGSRAGFAYGLAGMLAGASAGWLTGGFGAWRGWLPEPSRVGITLKRTNKPFFQRLVRALSLGLVFGPAGGLVFGLAVGLKFGLEIGLDVGLEDGVARLACRMQRPATDEPAPG